MPLSRAEIATPSGARLINRLCKHWAHKLEVEHTEQDAKIVFSSGTCLMHAEPERLLVSIETLEEEYLDQLEGVVESHLVRMAKDEPLEIVWEN
ncbi:DUF2218 domain-containing protein [Vreelandella piezotolerans]|uniref:DUF2218 domain-containing protein n=1 Tax=Vreelandella piezotolerans TaxID=2609667 RepID=A0ABQ6X8Q9_9GAMM|nr:DUF2218 domain-containing protein [Halomonas piezotolerans]KAE8438403.1 DUF2218 domain-containing protein [Halomonas piezotolerans]KFC50667.1 hypothetical protein DK37_12410 [Halomonas sp. SUBG004]QJA22911.1 DUF2218 domain-containing protein [Halomonas piezotolerans]